MFYFTLLTVWMVGDQRMQNIYIHIYIYIYIYIHTYIHVASHSQQTADILSPAIQQVPVHSKGISDRNVKLITRPY